MAYDQATKSQVADDGSNVVVAGATYHGPSVDTAFDEGTGVGKVGHWSKFRVMAFADQAGTVSVEQSRDGTTWRVLGNPAVTVTVANAGTILEALIVRRYVRVTFHNTSGSDTTICELDTLLLAV